MDYMYMRIPVGNGALIYEKKKKLCIGTCLPEPSVATSLIFIIFLSLMFVSGMFYCIKCYCLTFHFHIGTLQVFNLKSALHYIER